uniref:Uncharacterized protein n=1 Tax=Arundo donax TaxID=35708 RepID=A0A0A9GY91_ARUDO
MYNRYIYFKLASILNGMSISRRLAEPQRQDTFRCLFITLAKFSETARVKF